MLRRILKVSTDVFFWVCAAFYLLLFAAAIRNNYLTWIGVTAGILVLVDMVIGWLLRLTRNQRRVQMWGWVHGAAGGVIAGVFAVLPFLPDKGNWRPYRFDADLARIEKQRALPEGENAAEFYAPILENIDPTKDLEFFGQPEMPAVQFCVAWKDSDYPLFAARLDGLSDTIDELISVCQMEQCRWRVKPDFFKSAVPERYGRMKRCAATLIASANRDLGNADKAAAAVKYCCVLRMAEHFYQQPAEAEFYVGFALEEAAMKQINRFLVEGSPNSELIEFVSRRLLPSVNSWSKDWSNILEVKKLQCRNLLGRLYETSDEGKIRFTWPDTLDESGEQESQRRYKPYALYLALSMPLNPANLGSVVDRQFTDLDRMLEPGYQPYPWDFETDVRLRFSLDFVSKFIVNWYRWTIENLLMLKNEAVRFHQLYLQQLAMRRGSHIIVGLMQYKAQHGSWPGALDEIAVILPADTLVDPTNGKGFVYKPGDTDFRLYSAGFNGKDENGLGGWTPWLETPRPDDIPIWPTGRPKLSEGKKNGK